MEANELQAIIDGVTAKLQATAVSNASAQPGWIADATKATAKPNGKAATKAPKAASVKPHRVAVRSSFESGGTTYAGYRVIKMFGDVADKRHPDGKFILDSEVAAIDTLRGAK